MYVNDYIFKANGQTLKFKGFMTLYVEDVDNSKNNDDIVTLPELEVNQTLESKKVEPKQSFTEPPARYTEASLVKSLEEKGIGRPSTYSPTITTILERRYIQKEKKQLVPTELGKIVNKLLTENFKDIINVEFTAKIEEEFDEIAEGKEYWKDVIREFYGPFSVELARVEKELEHVVLVDEVSDVPCDKCGRMMVYKYGRYGKFLACPGFPECKNAKPIVETVDVPCPCCGGTVQIRKTKRRKNYYICENNPATCNYISWNKPKLGEKWNPDEAQNVEEKPKKKTRKRKKYVLNDDELEEYLNSLPENVRDRAEIARMKGLGEMDAEELNETTMDIEQRTLRKITVDDCVAADSIFQKLMGEEVEPRRKFIEENAQYVENLDI